MCNWLERKLLVYTMVEFVDSAWDREICLGLNLNEEPMKGDDVDDQPTPKLKLSQAHEYPNYYQIQASSGVFSCRCDEHAIFMGI